MQENKTCKCPICNQRFTPDDGLTPQEHLEKGLLKAVREMQDASLLYKLPCPRCGHKRMRENMVENALSYYMDIYICPECGVDEAMRDIEKKKPIPTAAWFIVSEIFKSVSGVRCENYIPEKHNPYPLCDNPACEISAQCAMSAHMKGPQD